MSSAKAPPAASGASVGTFPNCASQVAACAGEMALSIREPTSEGMDRSIMFLWAGATSYLSRAWLSSERRALSQLGNPPPGGPRPGETPLDTRARAAYVRAQAGGHPPFASVGGFP